MYNLIVGLLLGLLTALVGVLFLDRLLGGGVSGRDTKWAGVPTTDASGKVTGQDTKWS